MYMRTGTEPALLGNQSQLRIPTADVFPAGEGHIQITALTDEQTRSLWEHVTGEAIHGQLRGHQLEHGPMLEHDSAAQLLQRYPRAEVALSRCEPAAIARTLSSSAYHVPRQSRGHDLPTGHLRALPNLRSATPQQPDHRDTPTSSPIARSSMIFMDFPLERVRVWREARGSDVDQGSSAESVRASTVSEVDR